MNLVPAHSGFLWISTVNLLFYLRINVAQCTSDEFNAPAHLASFAVFSDSSVTYSIVQCTFVSMGNFSFFFGNILLILYDFLAE